MTSRAGEPKGQLFTITAYDLSVNSCGKSIDSSGYGTTASGFSLKGHTRASAMTVAADTSIIPMGSKIKLIFTNDRYKRYNGVYTVRDRGGAIKGRKLDFFMGDFNSNKTHQSVWDFGRTKAYVEIIN